MIGIVSSDSTVTYYTLTDGLLAPRPVDDQDTLTLKQHRKHCRHKERATVQ